MMELAYQPSMLDTVMPTVGPLTGGMVRHQLSRGAWVDHLPGWVLGSDAVLQTLLHDVDWRAERRKMYDGVVDVPRLLRLVRRARRAAAAPAAHRGPPRR